MKKIWIIAIIIACCFSVGACGNNKSQDSISSEKTGNRLDELRASKEKKISEEKAQEEYENNIKEAEEAEKEKKKTGAKRCYYYKW